MIDDDGNPTTPGDGVVGRLVRRGHIPLGYYKDEKKTAETFPMINGERWVVPGDMAVAEADGTITLLGRGSVSINSGGEKIFPEEVELVLKGHPKVFDAVVVGVPDERWGEHVAAVIVAQGGRPSDRAGAARLRRRAHRLLQAAQGAVLRRRDGAVAIGQGRLPVGEGAGGRSSSRQTAEPPVLGSAV